jgi:exonuclease III
MNILTWNVAWCGQRSSKFQKVQSRMLALEPSIACITETATDYMPDGEAIFCHPDHGYPITAGRHKVILWSRSSWASIDAVGHEKLPPGRFIYGETENIRVMGVCIPWHDAHVSTGRNDRKQWEEHLLNLEILREIISEKRPHLIMGDFNQRVPYDSKYPRDKNISDSLLYTLLSYNICSAGFHPRLVDHIAIAAQISVRGLTLIDPNWNGRELSDHHGIGCEIIT